MHSIISHLNMLSVILFSLFSYNRYNSQLLSSSPYNSIAHENYCIIIWPNVTRKLNHLFVLICFKLFDPVQFLEMITLLYQMKKKPRNSISSIAHMKSGLHWNWIVCSKRTNPPTGSIRINESITLMLAPIGAQKKNRVKKHRQRTYTHQRERYIDG